MSATKLTITYPNTLTNGTDADAAEVMANLNEISTGINTTGLGTDNIKDSAITTAKIEDANITTAKIADDAVTGAKLAPAVAGAGLAQDGSGNLDVTVDNSTIEIASDTLKVKDGGISLTKLASRPTGTSVAANGVAVSTGTGALTSTSSSTYADISGLSVTITTTGRPVVVGLMSSVTGTDAGIYCGGGIGTIAIYNGASALTYAQVGSSVVPPGALNAVAFPSAGTHTFQVKAKKGTGSFTYLENVKLFAYEI